ncbi:hypothetical protein BKA62DRAFT_658414 [Auriculariales sp. MPI-PUGE-AT-0066]|nr:hypothetical protein BKA62DRAFT_658414 [Auriculariales sp. MPI-PUGE-AT-0066]
MLKSFTVILRGEEFTVYQDQIEFDAPNYFTSIFLGDFSESQSRCVHLSRNPDLFRIIIEYLSGYDVLPLATAAIPARMTAEAALRNLRRDAAFYRLKGLESLVQNELEDLYGTDLTLSRLPCLGVAPVMVDFEDVLKGTLPVNVCIDRTEGLIAIHQGHNLPVLVVAHNITLMHYCSDHWWTLAPYFPVQSSSSQEKAGGKKQLKPGASLFQSDAKHWKWRSLAIEGQAQFLLDTGRVHPAAHITIDGSAMTGAELRVVVEALGWARQPSVVSSTHSPASPTALAMPELKAQFEVLQKARLREDVLKPILFLARRAAFLISRDTSGDGQVVTRMLDADCISMPEVAKGIRHL